ncbi:MAG TPA: prephenate dehydrogenase/arogenate dehydrogenase family protein, partial [Spirochaetota bacterium]|nr:prephenate dehydrogenase/arogenate dehydrogenase family protein [Spirochaetota bacterium]
MKYKEIGLIGYGNFGKFISKILSETFRIYVYDCVVKNDKNDLKNIFFSSIEETCSKDIIILSTPVQYLEDCLLKIRDLIKKDALVFDVCSVKIKPVELMLKYLPKTVEIIGTHPLFGPQSAKSGIANLNMVLTNVRSERFQRVKKFIEEKLDTEYLISPYA